MRAETLGAGRRAVPRRPPDPRCPSVLAGPGRTHLGRRVVANGEHEVALRSVGLRKFAPTLAAKPARFVLARAQQLERHRVNATLWKASGTVSAETAAPGTIQNRLGDDAARRVPGAEREHVMDALALFSHPDLSQLSAAPA